MVDECLAAIEAREADVHAFNLVLADRARAAADAIDARVARGEDPGPLAGVPVALKDNLCTRGLPTTCSSRILDGWCPPYDASVVERIVAAGGIIIGKTNLDEFAMGSSTENSAFGPTRNPHDLVAGARRFERWLGRRSGCGVRAACARQRHRWLDPPAGGVVRGRRRQADVRPRVALRPHRVRVVARSDRSVRDQRSRRGAAARSDRRSRRDGLDVDPASRPRRSSMCSTMVSTVCASASSKNSRARASLPTCWRSCTRPPRALEKAGAVVEKASVPATIYGLSAYYLIAPAEASSNLARYDGVRYGMRVEGASTTEMMEATRTAGFGAEVKRRIMLGTYALSAGYYDAYYGKAQRVRTLIIHDFARAYEHFDVLLSPTRRPLRSLSAPRRPIRSRCTSTTCARFRAISRVSRRCRCRSASVTTACPIGVQVLAPLQGEATMFRTAAVLEAAASHDDAPTATMHATSTIATGLGADLRARGALRAGDHDEVVLRRAATTSVTSPTPTCARCALGCPARCRCSTVQRSSSR